MAGLVQSFHQATAKFSTLDGPLLRFQELVFVNVAYLCGLWAIVRVMKHAPAFELRAFRVFVRAQRGCGLTSWRRSTTRAAWR
jgi:hypothetical protein